MHGECGELAHGNGHFWEPWLSPMEVSVLAGVAREAGLPDVRAAWEGGAPTVAFGVEFEDGAVVDKAVHGGEGHGGVGEDPVPFAEGVVGGDKQGAELVAGADELEEDAGLGLVLGDVGQVVEDEEVVRVELFDGGLEGELAAGDLELLDEVGGAGEEDAEAALDECQANAGGEVALAGARWADEYDVVPAGDPGVALGEGVDAGPREHGDGGEVEVGEGLSGRQARLGEVPAHAPDAALGDLVLGERGEQPGPTASPRGRPVP